MTLTNSLTVAVIFLLFAFAFQFSNNLALTGRRAQAESRADIAETELRKANEREIQTRNLLSMLSGQVEQTQRAFATVSGLDESVNALCHKMDASLERHLADARKVHAATVLEDRGHDRLVVTLNGEIAWLRKSLASDRSHNRAHSDLEAERLVRDAESRDTAIETAPPLLGPTLGPFAQGGAHRFSTQRRSEGPEDEPVGMTREPVAVASAGGPVPGTE